MDKKLQLYKDWVVDLTYVREDGLLSFIPIEGPLKESPRFVAGLNYVGSLDSFNLGILWGVAHFGGPEACDKWCKENKTLYEEILAVSRKLIKQSK